MNADAESSSHPARLSNQIGDAGKRDDGALGAAAVMKRVLGLGLDPGERGVYLAEPRLKRVSLAKDIDARLRAKNRA